MDDEQILSRGGTERDIEEYAKQNGADMEMKEESPSTEGITYKRLIKILSTRAGERGDNEGAADTLLRVIHERDLLLRRAIERDILHL